MYCIQTNVHKCSRGYGWCHVKRYIKDTLMIRIKTTWSWFRPPLINTSWWLLSPRLPTGGGVVTLSCEASAECWTPSRSQLQGTHKAQARTHRPAFTGRRGGSGRGGREGWWGRKRGEVARKRRRPQVKGGEMEGWGVIEMQLGMGEKRKMKGV